MARAAAASPGLLGLRRLGLGVVAVATAVAEGSVTATSTSSTCPNGSASGSDCGAQKVASQARSQVASADHMLLQFTGGGLGLLRSNSTGNESRASAELLRCRGLRGVERPCSSDGCTVLADGMRGRSCNQFCGDAGLACEGAWEEVHDDCRIKETLTCESRTWSTSDLLCRCAPPEGTSREEDARVADAEALTTFFWNVHWECSMGQRGASDSCKHRVGERFVELATGSGADIVASIMLADHVTTPASLPSYGLHNWTQVDGPCGHASGAGDTVALAFAPGWTVRRSAGGCLRHDADTRAFAVALVAPPTQWRSLRGCPNLCVLAVHAPHGRITRGRRIVDDVCGAAAANCSVAMGDWNVAAAEVEDLWADLLGGAPTARAEPDERTCCFPESHHYGFFDHVAFSVPGARHAWQTVYAYQLTEENPVKQHKAIAAQVLLPVENATQDR